MSLLDIFKRDDSGFLSNYTRAMSLLDSTKIFEFLRDRGKVQYVSPASPNYAMELAAQAEHSRGYNEALDDLLQFREKFLDTSASTMPPRDYGAIDRALQAGDLTEEEADAIRSSQ